MDHFVDSVPVPTTISRGWYAEKAKPRCVSIYRRVRVMLRGAAWRLTDCIGEVSAIARHATQSKR